MLKTPSHRFIIACTLTFVFALPLPSQQPKAPRASSVAIVKSGVITEDDLNAAAHPELERAEIQHLQSEAGYVRMKHMILERTLAGLIEDRVLEAEAASRGITKKELLEKELAGKVKEPTVDDVNAHFTIDKQPSADTRARVFERMRQYLKNENYNKAKEAYVAQLKKKYGVTEFLKPQRLRVETAGSPSLGSDKAPVTIVEFVNFQCSACSAFEKSLEDLVKNNGTQVRLVSRSFALEPPYSGPAAQAVLCAGDQGRFWEMHDLMLRSGHPEPQFFNMQASSLQLNLGDFGACLNSGRHADDIKKDLYAAAALGVSSTPALFVNGRPILTPRSVDDVAKVIEDELHSSLRASAAASPSGQSSSAPALTVQAVRK